jgi:hypothetical protein
MVLTGRDGPHPRRVHSLRLKVADDDGRPLAGELPVRRIALGVGPIDREVVRVADDVDLVGLRRELGRDLVERGDPLRGEADGPSPYSSELAMLTWMPSLSCWISTWSALISERSADSMDCCCASIELYVDCITQPPRASAAPSARAAAVDGCRNSCVMTDPPRVVVWIRSSTSRAATPQPSVTAATVMSSFLSSTTTAPQAVATPRASNLHP